MTTNPKIRRLRLARRGLPSRQKGVVLLIALIVLVSMTLAAIGMSRSVDTSNVVAGNLAFKQAALQGSDVGVQAATDWLSANSGGTTLQNTNQADGYYSSLPGSDPDWQDLNAWPVAKMINGGVPDAAGNVVRYVIHRMCTKSNMAYQDAGNSCAKYDKAGGASEGGSMAVGSFQFQGSPQLFYRITTRVDGPKGTVSVVQVNVMLEAS